MRATLIALFVCALSAPFAGATETPAPDEGDGTPDSPIELRWDMLVPRQDTLEDLASRLSALGLEEDGSAQPNRLGGIVSHGGAWLGEDSADLGNELVTEYNGKTVRLPGYVVPLDYDEDGSKNLLLVPFIGACIHVPPPPPNQIVVVQLEEKQSFEYFEPVFVTGEIRAIPPSLEIADVGYQIKPATTEPYPYDDAWEDNPGVDIEVTDEPVDEESAQ